MYDVISICPSTVCQSLTLRHDIICDLSVVDFSSYTAVYRGWVCLTDGPSLWLAQWSGTRHPTASNVYLRGDTTVFNAVKHPVH